MPPQSSLPIPASLKRPQHKSLRSSCENRHENKNANHSHNGPDAKFDERVIRALLHFSVHIAVFMISHESLLDRNNFVLDISTASPCHHVKAAQDRNNA
jgi:hypothetical protein